MRLFRQKEWPRQRKMCWLGWQDRAESSWRRPSCRTEMGTNGLWLLHFPRGWNAKLENKRPGEWGKEGAERTTQRQQLGQPDQWKLFQDHSWHSRGCSFEMPIWLHILQEWATDSAWVPGACPVWSNSQTGCKSLPDQLLATQLSQ